MDAKLGAEGRKDLFDWLSRQLTALADFGDAMHLLRPVALAMTVFLYCIYSVQYEQFLAKWMH